MFSSILSSASLNFGEYFACTFVSVVLGFLVAFVCSKTAKVSKDFLITIVLLPMLVESIILMVNGSLGTAVAVMGAFSLIRFRSLPGTSKEILIIFFTMVIGTSCGMGQIYFSILITLIGVALLVILDKTSILTKSKNEKVLKIVIPENLDYSDMYNKEFEEYTSKYNLIKTKTINMGSLFEITYLITFKENINEKEFIDKIRIKNGNLKITLSDELTLSEL